MGTVEVIFATVVLVLSAVCVILALVWAVCWLWVALRRVLARNRPPSPEEDFWRAQRALDGPR